MAARLFPSDFELLLASQSPRRRELLSALGVPYRVVASLAEEATEAEGGDPGALAEANAYAKAQQALLPRSVSARAFVLGTDTIVVAAGEVLGKPEDRDQATRMLRLLSGKVHEVTSAAALLWSGGELVGRSTTLVRFAPLEDADIEAYVDSGEWEGKAGGYAIQGLAALFVLGIEGEYANVVGLPIELLGRLFRGAGFDLLRARWL